jgi:hypothetical protein
MHDRNVMHDLKATSEHAASATRCDDCLCAHVVRGATAAVGAALTGS